MSDEPDDRDEFDEFDDGEELDDAPLDGDEARLVEQDLADLDAFEAAFTERGFRGVSVFCPDCVEEHYYPWAMLRENLQLLLDTGETPVHEPAFAPEPDRYIPWDYARGYVDALHDAGVDQRREVVACPRCGAGLDGPLQAANFCPRCAAPLLGVRLDAALAERGVPDDERRTILREAGLPG